jgi:adenylosuccinate lyase
VRALSTEPARFQSWLDVEAALAGRRPSWAFIPEAAGHDIDRKAHVKYLDRGDRGLTDERTHMARRMTVTPQICAASTVGFARCGLVPMTWPRRCAPA